MYGLSDKKLLNNITNYIDYANSKTAFPITKIIITKIIEKLLIKKKFLISIKKYTLNPKKINNLKIK